MNLGAITVMLRENLAKCWEWGICQHRKIKLRAGVMEIYCHKKFCWGDRNDLTQVQKALGGRLDSVAI